jgi:GNAT superfamily N-acetyltransferase
MNDIKIRKANREDVEIILRLIKELAVYEKLEYRYKATEKLIEKNLFGEQKYAEVLIAEYKNEPAGQAVFFHNFSTFLAKPGIYLEDLYVRPHLRGKGIGKSLLFEVIKIAKKRKCNSVEWVVLNWNEPAIQFYKKLGALPINDWKTFRLTEDKF